ncbi:thiamine biosynthesis enzyme ThiH [Aeropyrum camini SY1 = JCM 12091]|uniref:Thiamine biosynthesis enzyme ThiH n=2 Tax=Aeropyrum camini TaxID=229980 RepID=U3TEB7_9CREN|nr:thiamine biosynthesis enzyme ThiH [Aeropyrum camini SY1 = JCM 12091]
MSMLAGIAEDKVLENILKSADELGLGDALFNALEGRASARDIVELYKAPTPLLGAVARRVTDLLTGRRVGYIVNMIMNYTNICVVGCTFCSFYRKSGHPEAYKLEAREAASQVIDAWRRYKIRQVLFQGGVDPAIPLEYYEEAFKTIKTATRGEVAIHGLSVVEIEWLSRISRMSVGEVVERLKNAGMDSVPGAGAEILSDRVRRVISPLKSSADTWISTMETIMEKGLPISATMVYGHVETLEERAEHLLKLLELQRRRGRIMAFIAWNFEPENNVLGKKIPHPAGGTELLKTVAIARIVFRGEIKWIQAGWLTAGVKLGQATLEYGANDWGGTLYGEKVLPEAGVPLPKLVRRSIERLIAEAGYEPVERDNWYKPVPKNV